MNDPLRIGIIGLGGVAHLAHLKAFSALEGVTLAAGCDHTPAKFDKAREYLDTFYTDHREMLEKEKLDGVVIGTPNPSHVALSEDALRAGVGVLCEKPVAPDQAGAGHLEKVVRETKGKLMIGLSFRFRPQTAAIQDILAQGKLGEIYYCRGQYLRQRGIPGLGTWFTQQESGGGVLLDLGVHVADYFWFLLGKPAFQSVTSHAYGGIGRRIVDGEKAGFHGSAYPSTHKKVQHPRFDVEEMVSAFIRFRNGVVLQMEVTWALNDVQECSTGMLFGDRGGLMINPVKVVHDEPGKLTVEEIPVEQGRSHDFQAAQFARYLRGEIENPTPIEDGVEIMRLLDAVRRSAAEGKEIIL